MYVKTKDGMRIVAEQLSRMNTSYNYYIDVENLRIRFAKDQLFYRDGKPIDGYHLKFGDRIDTIHGQAIVTKANLVLGKSTYYNLGVDSPRANFCLINGVIVCQ